MPSLSSTHPKSPPSSASTTQRVRSQNAFNRPNTWIGDTPQAKDDIQYHSTSWSKDVFSLLNQKDCKFPNLRSLIIINPCLAHWSLLEDCLPSNLEHLVIGPRGHFFNHLQVRRFTIVATPVIPDLRFILNFPHLRQFRRIMDIGFLYSSDLVQLLCLTESETLEELQFQICKVTSMELSVLKSWLGQFTKEERLVVRSCQIGWLEFLYSEFMAEVDTYLASLCN